MAVLNVQLVGVNEHNLFPSKAFGMGKSTSFTNYITALLTIPVTESTSAAGSSLVANVFGERAG